jgi:hypothetical protein
MITLKIDFLDDNHRNVFNSLLEIITSEIRMHNTNIVMYAIPHLSIQSLRVYIILYYTLYILSVALH